MGWLCGLIEVFKMASNACGRCVRVISIMAGYTIIGNDRMGAIQRIKIIMIRKGRGVPVRGGGVTGSTVCGEPAFTMIRIDTLIKI